MATRAAPGGNSTVSLGSADPKESFEQRREERRAPAETPDAVQRFPQAPGGDTSISLRGDAPAEVAVKRGPVGGAATVVLGSDGDDEALKRRQEAAPLEAPVPAMRFTQAPGGNTSVCLGGSEAPSAQASRESSPRGPVGGASSVVLGSDDEGRFARSDVGSQVGLDTPAASPRFKQAPGGTASISLGGDGEGVVGTPVRGPVGGAASVTLGSDSSTEAFALRKQEREAAVSTPPAVPRFQQAPGGSSSLSLGGAGGAPEDAADPAAPRAPVGGLATVVLGSEDSRRLLDEYQQQQRAACVDTPAAQPRFPQAPGGSSNMSLASSSDDEDDAPVTVRGPVGGASSICLGGGEEAPQPFDAEAAAARAPVGGAASVVLGTDDAKADFEERQESRRPSFETPAAAQRFTQVPGGTASISLGGDEASADAAVAPRGPVGGAATVVLGSDDSKKVFSQRQEDRAGPTSTPDASPRFTQAPGGNSSDCWAADGAQGAEAPAVRGPVGGAASVHLGSDDSAAALRLHEAQRSSPVSTPEASPRFQQAPGGTSSLSLTSDGAPEVLAARGPVGGEATLVLGVAGADAEAFRRPQAAADVETPDPAPRFQQAPGGDASISLSSQAAASQPAAVRGEVGGAATVVLGADNSQEILRQHQEQRRTNVDTPAAAPRFPQMPGGTAQIVLAGGTPDAVQAGRQAPGGAATVVLGGGYPEDIVEKRQSANAFAQGSNQNAGNVLTERPTTRLHQAPGGTSTLVLGASDADTPAKTEKGSSNAFATGSNQNAGNVLTERPSTRLHQAPGGTSALVLGGGEDAPAKATKTSANAFATGSNQNAGNVLTERPTTRLHQAPGGTSAIVLGGGDDAPAPVSANAFAKGANQNAGNVLTDRPTTRLHQAPGGASSLCLGGDYPEGTGPAPGKAAPSANRFASGANQNAGNVLTERSTTRLHQAPGGNSSLCLGGDIEKPAPAKAAARQSDENLDASNTAPAQQGNDTIKPPSSGAATGVGAVVLG